MNNTVCLKKTGLVFSQSFMFPVCYVNCRTHATFLHLIFLYVIHRVATGQAKSVFFGKSGVKSV